MYVPPPTLGFLRCILDESGALWMPPEKRHGENKSIFAKTNIVCRCIIRKSKSREVRFHFWANAFKCNYTDPVFHGIQNEPHAIHKDSQGLTRHLASQGLTRHHKASQGLTRIHKAQGFTRTHKDSQGFTRFHKAQGSTRTHKDSQGHLLILGYLLLYHA